ncbi:MAG: DMT family transporter [Anaerolineaceae bacterium]|nr:DMT family transporter [Anaerolineaceae bacterium]
MAIGLVILVGIIGGVAVGLQTPFSSFIGQRVGANASSFIIHFSGAILSALFLFVNGGEKISNWRALPWYVVFVGIFGVILFQTINVTMPRLGTAMSIALIIIGQLTIGILIDHFGLLGATSRPIDLTKVLGVVALFIGGYLIAK